MRPNGRIYSQTSEPAAHRVDAQVDAVERFRRSLPVVQSRTYVDNAAVAPISLSVQAAVTALMQARCQHGKQGLIASRADVLQRAREHAAALLNARPDELALVHNTTEGINIIASGLDWTAGDNLLLPDNEFPANVYPWLALQARGVELRRIPTRAGALHIEDIRDRIDHRTRVLALSHVGYVSGFRADLETIGALCKRRGVRFVVDAAQSMGALSIDVRAAQIDALACSGWKWLLGPTGVGLLFVSDAFLDCLQPVFIGAGSMLQGEAGVPAYPFELKPDARRFEFSSENVDAICGLATALGELRAIGIDRIEQRVCGFAAMLHSELRRHGFELHCDRDAGGGVMGSDPARLSGIVSLRKPGIPCARLLRHLDEHGISCSAWHDHVRLSPHFYNTASEIESITNTLLAVS